MIPANYSTISFPALGIEVNPLRSITLGRWEISDKSGLAFQWIGG